MISFLNVEASTTVTAKNHVKTVQARTFDTVSNSLKTVSMRIILGKTDLIRHTCLEMRLRAFLLWILRSSPIAFSKKN